jgi:hypothetical protein
VCGRQIAVDITSVFIVEEFGHCHGTKQFGRISSRAKKITEIVNAFNARTDRPNQIGLTRTGKPQEESVLFTNQCGEQTVDDAGPLQVCVVEGDAKVLKLGEESVVHLS